MVDSIKSVLMSRDGMSEEEADELIKDARKDLYKRLDNGEMPDDICSDWFGLEPDYINDLVGL